MAGDHGTWRETTGHGGREDMTGDHGTWRETMGHGGRPWDMVGEKT